MDRICTNSFFDHDPLSLSLSTSPPGQVLAISSRVLCPSAYHDAVILPPRVLMSQAEVALADTPRVVRLTALPHITSS